jgi:hypothetical protein
VIYTCFFWVESCVTYFKILKLSFLNRSETYRNTVHACVSASLNFKPITDQCMHISRWEERWRHWNFTQPLCTLRVREMRVKNVHFGLYVLDCWVLIELSAQKHSPCPLKYYFLWLYIPFGLKEFKFYLSSVNELNCSLLVVSRGQISMCKFKERSEGGEMN